METYPYRELYNDFINSYKRGMVSGEEVGEVIAKLAGFYSDLNLSMVECERKLSIVIRDIEMRTDETSGKPISSTKAKSYSDATPECHAFNVARAHFQNCEMLIQSLKALQKGVLNEYAHSSL